LHFRYTLKEADIKSSSNEPKVESNRRHAPIHTAMEQKNERLSATRRSESRSLCLQQTNSRTRPRRTGGSMPDLNFHAAQVDGEFKPDLLALDLEDHAGGVLELRDLGAASH